MKYWANQCHIQQFWGAASFLTSATRKTIVQLGSLEGVLQALPSGVQEQSPGGLSLICILSSSKHPSCGSTCCGTSVWKVNCLFFGWINFYTFDSLGVWVWDPRLVYQLQNSSGYSTVAENGFNTGLFYSTKILLKAYQRVGLCKT